jgi:hypothetical protein
LGRPKGGKNKNHPLEPYREQIKAHLKVSLDVATIRKLSNQYLKTQPSYKQYRYYIMDDEELRELLEAEHEA